MDDLPTTLAVEDLSQLLDPKGPDWPRIQELLQSHWQEVALNKGAIKLAPDYGRYLQLGSARRVHVIVLRRAGAIVGYSVHFLVHGHPHYRNLFVAEDDIHYVIPSLRGTDTHEAMRRFALRTLKERGVEMVTARFKARDRSHDAVMERLGYERSDIIYVANLTKWVDKPKE